MSKANSDWPPLLRENEVWIRAVARRLAQQCGQVAPDEFESDAIVTCYLALKSYKEQGKPQAFFARVIKNRLYTYLKQGNPSYQIALDEEIATTLNDDGANNPYWIVERNEFIQIAWKAMKDLPIQHKIAIWLWLQDASHKEVAEYLSISPSRSQNLRLKALQQLKDRVQENLLLPPLPETEGA